MEKKISDSDLTAKAKIALRGRYQHPEWDLFFEVWCEGRGADCIAFNMFPSRNFKIIGFEIKASRGDWLNELRNGAKADIFVRQCDEWYIVQAKPGVVKKEELPKGWGLLTLRKSRLYTEVNSTIDVKGVPSREFFVRMIQHSYNQNISDMELYQAEEKGYKKGKKEGFDSYDLRDLKEKAKLVDVMKEKGLNLWVYHDLEIQKLVNAKKFLGNIGEWGMKGDLDNLKSSAERLLKNIEESKKILKEVKESVL